MDAIFGALKPKVAVSTKETIYYYDPTLQSAKAQSLLKNRYGIDSIDNDDLVEVYETIGKRIGAVVSGGEIDYDRVSNTILEDIKNERIKGITFDRID